MKAEKKPIAVVGRTDDLHRRGPALILPQLLLEELPMDAAALATVTNARQAIHRVLQSGRSPLAVVGPCSIHDSKAALEYAARREGRRPPRRGPPSS